MWRKGTHPMLGMQSGAATTENSIKLKTELPYNPAAPLLGMYLEKMKIRIQKDICFPVFMAAIAIYNSHELVLLNVPKKSNLKVQWQKNGYSRHTHTQATSQP